MFDKAQIQVEIAHSACCIGTPEWNNVADVLRSGYLKGGVWVKALQERIAGDMGMAGAMATHTGSLAIFLALKALELPASSKVVVPAYVCQNVATAVRMAGLTPLFCDVTLEDCSLNSDSVERSLDETVGAVIVAHLFGNVANVGAFKRFGVPIVEDAVQCPGGKDLGKYTDLLVLSFEGTKPLCAGEAGILLFKTAALKERAGEVASMGDICSLTPTDLQAAVAMAQWARCHEMIDRRRFLANRYNEAFYPHGIQPIWVGESLFSRYVVRDCKNVDEMIALAAQERIHLRRPVDPRAIAAPNWESHSVTRHFVSTNLSLPIYPDLTESDQDRVIRVVLENIEII